MPIGEEVCQEFFSAERAEKFRPVLRKLQTKGSRKPVREGAHTLLEQLEFVSEGRDYSPLPGHQVLLSASERVAFDVAKEELGEV